MSIIALDHLVFRGLKIRFQNSTDQIGNLWGSLRRTREDETQRKQMKMGKFIGPPFNGCSISKCLSSLYRKTAIVKTPLSPVWLTFCQPAINVALNLILSGSYRSDKVLVSSGSQCRKERSVIVGKITFSSFPWLLSRSH